MNHLPPSSGHHGRSLAVLLPTLLLLLGTSVFALSTQTYWYESYEKAAYLIDKGKFDEASPILDTLIERYPAPVASVRIPGDRFLTYAPYYHRARIEFARSDFPAALESLQISKAHGALVQDRRALQDIENLLQQIADKPASGSTNLSKAESARP